MRWTRADWLNLLLFAGLVILFYWRILTPDAADRQSFPPGDFYDQFWAFATFEVRELSAGRLPLWNPYTFAGAPFWADVQSAVFYPFSLLTLLLSAPWGFSAFALELEAIAHFWLAAVFMYLFVREITRSRAAAFIAALIFTFSGYLTGYPSQQLAVLEADVWLPLILFFLYRARRRTSEFANGRIGESSSRPFLILAGAALGMTLLAGHPQSALIVGYLSSVYLLFLWLGGGARSREQGAGSKEQGAEKSARKEIGNSQSAIRNDSPRSVAEWGSQSATDFTFPFGFAQDRHVSRFTFPFDFAQDRHVSRFTFHVSRFLKALLTFLLTGLALAAIQFIPAVEYTIHSVRAEGTYDRMSGGLPLIDVVQFLLPGQVSLYSPLYVGVVGLLLALGVTFTAPNRHAIFWAVVAAITLLITFGGNTFLYSPLYLGVPGFSIFRGQERWAFGAAFSLSVLAGYGFCQLSIVNCQLSKKLILATRGNSQRQSPQRSGVGSAIRNDSPRSVAEWGSQFLLRSTQHLFFFALLLALAFFYGLNDTGWNPASPFYDLLGGATLLTILLALAWSLWKFAPRLHPTLFTAFTAALICFDLFSVNWQTNLYPQPPEWHTQVPATVQAIQADAALTPGEPYRVYNEFRLYDNYGVPFQQEDLWGASPLRPSRYDEFLAPPMPIERTWELLNVKYVITWRETLYLPSTIIYQEPAADGVTYVHRLETVGPRAWLVDRIEAADDATILQKIADPSFDRWHIALLEEDGEFANLRMGEFANGRIDESANDEPGTQHPSHFTFPFGFAQDRHVSRFTFHVSRLIYEVSTPSPALLILSEPYYPGWQATVDGQPAPLLRANYVLRAVPVPAGEHTVELAFRPLSFTAGAVVSGLALLIIVVTLGRSVWQVKR